jgi:hypothetical protein
MNMNRPSYGITPQAPGTEPTAEAAAALAVGYLVFKEEGTGGATDYVGREWWSLCAAQKAAWSLTHNRGVCGRSDSVYAEELLAHARQQYDLAEEHQAQFHFSEPFYK